MDEAERCHKLAYIAYGRLLAQGTAARIVASQGLVTYAVEGAGAGVLVEKLRGVPGVEQVASFGAAVHVTGRDARSIEATLAQAAEGSPWRWSRTDTGLEDVFIHLVREATDNYGSGGKP